jgi:enoyl-CoA hydratase/carnithine racemase
MQQQHVTQPTFETLDLAIDAHVAEVFLNRGDKANSMNAAMWRELQACFEWLDSEPTVRAVVLAAHGKHFCAGIDLAMLAEVHGRRWTLRVAPKPCADTFWACRTICRLSRSAASRCWRRSTTPVSVGR